MCHDSWVSCRCNPHPNPFLWCDHRRRWFVQQCETLLCSSWQWGNCPMSFPLVCISVLLFVECAIFMCHFFPLQPSQNDERPFHLTAEKLEHALQQAQKEVIHGAQHFIYIIICTLAFKRSDPSGLFFFFFFREWISKLSSWWTPTIL